MSPGFLFFCIVALSLPALIHSCGGLLAMVYRAPDVSDTAAYFSSLYYTNGIIANITRVDEIYADRDVLAYNQGFGHTAYDFTSGLFFYTSGNGKFIWAITKSSGNYSQFAELPDDYAEVIGMNVIINADSTSTVVLTTIDTVYAAPIVLQEMNGHPIAVRSAQHSSRITADTICESKKTVVQEPFVVVPGQVTTLVSLLDLSISPDAVVTVSDTTKLFIVSELSMYVIDLAAPPKSIVAVPLKSSNSSQPLSTIMDLQYHVDYDDRSQDRLVVVDTYRLFFIDPVSGTADYVRGIPDGPGFPRNNALFTDQFFFADFQYVYVMGLTYDHEVDTPQPFNSYFAQGNFQFFY